MSQHRCLSLAVLLVLAAAAARGILGVEVLSPPDNAGTFVNQSDPPEQGTRGKVTARASPTVNLTAPSYTNTNPIMMTAVFSRAVSGFSSADIIVTVTTDTHLTVSINPAVNGSGTTFTWGATLTPTVAFGTYTGNFTFQIKAGAATANNNGDSSLASSVVRVIYDKLPPSLERSLEPWNYTYPAMPIQAYFTFTEPVINVPSDFWSIIHQGIADGGANITYDYETIIPNMRYKCKYILRKSARVNPPWPYGSPTCYVQSFGYWQNATFIKDLAGNSLNPVASESPWVCWEPWAIVQTTATGPRKDPFLVNVTWNNNMMYFGPEQVVVSKGVVSNFVDIDGPLGSIGVGKLFSFTVTPTEDGILTVDIPPGTVHQVNSMLNVYPQPFQTTKVNISIQVDVTGPTVVISCAVTATNVSPITFTATFNEPAYGVTLAAFVATNGAVSGFTAISGGLVYRVIVVPAAEGPVTLKCIEGTNITDVLGNVLIYDSNVRTVIYDITRPTVTLTSSAAAVTNVLPVPITATFSEPVFGFNISGVSLQGGWSIVTGSFAGSSELYTFSVRPNAVGATAFALGPRSQTARILGFDAAGNSMEFDPP